MMGFVLFVDITSCRKVNGIGSSVDNLNPEMLRGVQLIKQHSQFYKKIWFDVKVQG